MKPKLKNMITIGSTLKPGLSSVYNLNIVPELPPAPADLVLVGLAFFTVSLWSAAARRRMADRGPPGGEPARAIEEVDLPAPEGVEESGPDSGPEVSGDEGRGEACMVSDIVMRGRAEATVFPSKHNSMVWYSFFVPLKSL